MSAELDDSVVGLSGEALAVLRSVQEWRGCLAWQWLHQLFDPKTVARALRLLADTCLLVKVKELIGEVDALQGSQRDGVSTT